MPKPTVETPANGGLWREVVNFLGDTDVAPELILPLLDHVAARWSSWTNYMGVLEEKLHTPSYRDEIISDLERAKVGYRLWKEKREQLRRWADAGPEGPLTDEDFEEWWLGDAYLDKEIGDGRGDSFMSDVIGSDLDARRVAEPAYRKFPDDFVIWLHWHLHLLGDLEQLRALASKTWGADDMRARWTEDDLDWVNVWFSDHQPLLIAADRQRPDHNDVQVIYIEQSLPFGGSDLLNALRVLIRAAVADFVEELLEANRYASRRGSLQCVECSVFVGRAAAGYGQRYCSDTCKRRAAKRRQRSRTR